MVARFANASHDTEKGDRSVCGQYLQMAETVVVFRRRAQVVSGLSVRSDAAQMTEARLFIMSVRRSIIRATSFG